MSGIWPWLAVAGVGALHGLNPASGWLLAAACGVRSRDRSQTLRALMPIALGHVASIGLVAGAVALGMSWGGSVLQVLAASMLVVVVVHVSHRRAPVPLARRAGLALWSFIASTAHGAGLMLVPALIPLCVGDAPAREITASGSLALTLAAVGVHMAAMLAVMAVAARQACRGLDALLGKSRRFWTEVV